MKSFFNITLFFLISVSIHAQSHLQIERDVSDGVERVLSVFHNLSNGYKGYTGMDFRAGSGSVYAQGSITQSNLDYTAIPDWKGYLSIWSGSSGVGLGNGINLAALEGNAHIRFYTLGAQPENLRMLLDADGHLGIGTPDPVARLQVANGDIYLSDVSSGVIMKSPNGTCFRMTVSDTGTPVFEQLTDCP